MKISEIAISPGTIINGCRIISEVGSGGMGTVYKAHDETLDRFVAIKIMHAGAESAIGKTRFVREASAIAQLDHSGIIKIYSYGEYNGQPFFIMEYFEGWTIKDFLSRCRYILSSQDSVEDLLESGYIKRSTPDVPFFLQDQITSPLLNPEYSQQIKLLMLSAASALAAAHKQGIIHRDIKSSNLLIVGDDRVKLLDFGLVKQVGDLDITRADQFMGTLTYASPEQLMGNRGKVTARTDVYGFGMILYELATLQNPIKEEDPAAIVAAIINNPFPRPSSINPLISANLEKIIIKCLQKAPEKRYKDGAALYDALRGESHSSAWFSGFTQMLKGWFLKENHPPDHEEDKKQGLEVKPIVDPKSSAASSKEVAAKYFKTARKKFFKNFAIVEAIESLKQAIEIEPGNVDTLFLLSFSLNAIGQSSEVESFFIPTERLLVEPNEKDQGKLLLIRAIFIARNFDDGKRRATRLQQIFPEDLDFLLALFFCYEALGNYTEAIKVGGELSLRLPDNNIVAVAQSECYFSVMDFDRSVEILRERIEKYPDYHNLRLKVIQSLLISGKFAEALLEVETALKKDPLNMLLQFYHGRILVFCRRYKDAFSAFRLAVSVPGDDGLRAIGFYCLYRLMELMNQPDAAQKYLRQARELKKKMEFLSYAETREIIAREPLSGLIDEIGQTPWLEIALSYARKICFDAVDLQAFTIGNHGCTSIMEIGTNGKFSHHAIYSNFNFYDTEELYAQLWLAEYPQSPFVDESGNILTCQFYEIKGVVPGWIASITLTKPWGLGRGSHIYCRLSDGELQEAEGKTVFNLPKLPMPACRHQAFLIVVPDAFTVLETSLEPDQVVQIDLGKTYCYFPHLAAAEVLALRIDLK